MAAARYDNLVLRRIIRATPERGDALIRAAAAAMLSDIVLSFNTSPEQRGEAGRDERGRYTKGKVTSSHSLPGYPPNVDTGTLRASMRWESAGPMRAIIYSGVEYAEWLEFGTENMAARPFMYPVFVQWQMREFVKLARDFGVFDG